MRGEVLQEFEMSLES